MKAASSIGLTVNRKRIRVAGVPDDERLLDTLRWRLGLRGTKEGCRTGDCGACTVLIDGHPALSCLRLTHEIAGARVLTVEGASGDPAGRRVQAAFAAEPALQCGYCTPGFVLATMALLNSRKSTRGPGTEFDELQGNLCRCTGYLAIQRAVSRLLAERT